ncbi:hypothetical protein D3C83_155660 [compost metagenome]
MRFHVTNAFRKVLTDNRAGLAARVHALLDAHRRAGGGAGMPTPMEVGVGVGTS